MTSSARLPRGATRVGVATPGLSRRTVARRWPVHIANDEMTAAASTERRPGGGAATVSDAANGRSPHCAAPPSGAAHPENACAAVARSPRPGHRVSGPPALVGRLGRRTRSMSEGLLLVDGAPAGRTGGDVRPRPDAYRSRPGRRRGVDPPAPHDPPATGRDGCTAGGGVRAPRHRSRQRPAGGGGAA